MKHNRSTLPGARTSLAVAAGIAVALLVATAVSPAAAARPNKPRCETAWYEWQYFSIAPQFPTTLPVKERNRLVKECRKAGRLPDYNTQVRLTQQAFNVTAQILEREIRRVSVENNVLQCEAAYDVLKPVGPGGRKPLPGDATEGYSADSFLPITRYNWFGGPFRLKYSVCDYGSLWLFADPYPPADSHPDRFPTDAEVKKNPWPRTPVEARMSTCITWGPGLGNDGVGGEGFIFGFMWDETNLPQAVQSCYRKALGLDGLDRYPFEVVPNLPL